MLLTFTSAIIYLAVRDFALKNVPLGFIREVWKEWELRLVTVVSMSLQFLLVFSGRLRSRYQGSWMLYITIMAFLTYQLANYAATVVLSTLMRGPNIGSGSSPLATIWTPFFLSHLGSPYNITAFSLEDNDLWRRYFFGALIHVFQAAYICLRFGNDFNLKMIAIPVLLAGIIRYGEKIWALRAASTSNLMTYISSSQQIMVTVGDEQHLKNRRLDKNTVNTFLGGSTSEEIRLYRRAYLYFSAFRRLFSDLPLYTVRQDTAVEAIDLKSGTAEEAFKTVEMELEYLYDVLYTKTPIRLSVWGTVSYAFCFISMLCSVIGFTVLVIRRRYFVIRPEERLMGRSHELGSHPITDILITYLLMLGAIVLDILGGLHHVQSKWAVATPSWRLRWMYKFLEQFRRLQWMCQRRGGRKVALLDMLPYSCSKLTTRFKWVVNFVDTENLVRMARFTQWEKVDPELKMRIFNYLKHKHDLILLRFFDFSTMVGKELQPKGAALVDHLDGLHNLDFVRCVFVLHIATNLLYYDDSGRYPGGAMGKGREIAKTLSDYMSYLAMVHPYMLPKGINEQIRDDTDKQARTMFHHKMIASLPRWRQRDISMIMKVVINGLMHLGQGTAAVQAPQELRNESALGDGVTLAKKLQYLVSSEMWDHEEKWELIANLWVRMLVYAAELCPWKEHAKQLPNGGGELLTHVSLLLAHLHLASDFVKEMSNSSSQLPVNPPA